MHTEGIFSLQSRKQGGIHVKKTAAAAAACLLALTGTELRLPASAETLTAETQSYYAAWKETYLRKNPYVTDADQYYVFYGDQTYAEAQKTVPVTVSEAHGYGMLITVMMADYDPEAKDIFDGMYRYYLAHLSEIGPHLMAWQQSDNGSALIDTNGADSATDGDLDIAYALLLADSLWGSKGTYDYLETAKCMIDDMMKYEISHVRWVPRLGDWAYDPDEEEKYRNRTGAAGGWPEEVSSTDYLISALRSSDLILQYFPVFASVSGDDRWINVYNASNGVIHEKTAFTKYGLLSDFLLPNHVNGWSLSPPNLLEGEHDGAYSYNACRTPWRIGTDALLNGNPEAVIYAEKVNACIREACGGDPKKISAGYEPVRGYALVSYGDLCFTAPLMISAAAAGDTEFHDAIRAEVLDIGMDSYYGNSIAMLCLITDDGGWLVPDTEKRIGDINRDYLTNISDVTLLSGWLTGKPWKLSDWEAGDMNGDGRLDARDLTLLKRYLLDKAQRETVPAQSLT